MRYELRSAGCDEVLANLWEYLDAELDPGAAPAITAHLVRCSRCRTRMLASRRMLAVVRAIARSVRAPAALRRRVLALSTRRD